ncbi:eukaryotic rRNA processing protein EBP2 [Colletotrichum orchidophilum]|uniref:Eukaryotic rRNA processing protein EBP2 n=1 Tax=Colletotrichum orchidophilum TaxID=1209926 RepID=A0A1G4AS95_9PEZI|nr:eukaryotic rRNA processing protein EBP2 [Colletotrichum orchidophilum]OHE91902.1 eukaryotic rRNA processing protein EBP2 [Colletotrichum orchidophilum]
MVIKSKLKLALAAEKGIDLRKVKEERKIKAKHREIAKAQEKKQKKNKGVEEDDEDEEMGGDESEDEDDASVISIEGGITLNAEFEDADLGSDSDLEEEDAEEDDKLDIEALDDTDSDSDSDIEMEAKIERPSKKAKTANKTPTKITQKDGATDEDDEDDSEVDPEEDDVPLSDLEGDDEDLEDIIPHTKLTINNKAALLASLNRIRIDTSSAAPFTSHMTVASSKLTAEAVPDAQDDLQRELALLSQSLEAARKGRALLIKEGTPFSRPKDYFAEMVKDDGQMEKVKAKLIEEASSKKAAAEARKLRDLKKFGKQVQVAKLQERQKAKKDTLDKIKTLKRKRQENSSNLDTREADLFDVGVDNEIKSHTNSDGKRGGRSGSGVNAKRSKKNEKYGFGGKKRHAKSGDAVSSGDLSGFNAKRMKGGIGKKPQQRPGKNRRKAMNK